MKKMLFVLTFIVLGVLGGLKAWQASLTLPCGVGVTTVFWDHWSLDECQEYYDELVDIYCN